MTKKLICLLLAAFLCVSIIALFAACRSGSRTPPENADAGATSSASPQESSILSEAADVFSLELPSEESAE